MIAAAWLTLSGHLTLGDLLVFVGAVAAAFYGRKLAVATYELDRRTAARERKRRERQIRGVARLVYGEMESSLESIGQALESGTWTVTFGVPSGAWDRDGALIAEAVAEDTAQTLIDCFAKSASWRTLVQFFRQTHPNATDMTLTDGQREMLTMILAVTQGGQRDLRSTAYPDARELEPDPDSLLAHREQTARRLRRRRR